MATPPVSSASTNATSKGNRGKHQIQWSADVWKALDEAVTAEMMRTRVAARILPQVHVPKKRTSVESDIVIVPIQDPVQQKLSIPFDAALSVEESKTTRIQEYWTTFVLSVAQVEAEGDEETHAANQGDMTSPQGTASNRQSTMGAVSHRASTAVSLALRSANILAQAEDLVLLNGSNAVLNSPLFLTNQVQFLDTTLQADLDQGLLNINPMVAATLATPPVSTSATITAVQLPVTQVIPVHPSDLGGQGSPPRYAENILNAVAQAFSLLQGLAHYENYALILHTIPYADLHQALKHTLIEPVEPISHLVKGGICGTGTLPPFVPITPSSTQPGASTGASGGPPGPVTTPPNTPTGLPTHVLTTPATNSTPAIYTPLANLPQFNSIVFPEGTTTAPPAQPAAVLYTGILVSLSGNTMDQVRGLMEDSLDVCVTFNQKDQNEKYRFRVVQRQCLRLKDPTAVGLFLFMDS